MMKEVDRKRFFGQCSAIILMLPLLFFISGCSAGSELEQHSGSFLEGTMIHTAEGMVPIEQITPGMAIRSFEPAVNEWKNTTVLAVSRESYSGTIVTIETKNSTIKATASHVFLMSLDTEIGDNEYRTIKIAPYAGLIQAQYLYPDDRLLMPDGEIAVVKNIDNQSVSNVPVYDLVAEETHLLLAGEEGIVAGDKSIVITKSGYKYSEGSGCFAPGTPVATPDGFRRIEEMECGNSVLSFDPDSMEWTVGTVTSVFDTPYQGIMAVINPGKSSLTVSGNHPVYVLDGKDLSLRPAVREVPADDLQRFGLSGTSVYGSSFSGSRWVEALHLKAGDVIAGVTGIVEVDEIIFENMNTRIHNIEIAGTHTYAAGMAGILVHNKGQAEQSSGAAGGNRMSDVATESFAAIAEEAPAPQHQENVPSQPEFNTEEYSRIYEQRFLKVVDNPLSTLSIDVDTAAYSNIRRFIQQGNQPVQDAARIEEMINYFDYDYPQPSNEHPFAFYTELSTCPWNEDNQLLHVGLKGKEVPMADLPPNNIVFLLDVSGSMSSANKLPLLKQSLALLIGEMRDFDTISIVVYAGAAGLVLPPTSCSDKDIILGAMDRLYAGGSTAGGAGIKLAYDTALENFNPQGNNRVVLGTDGDFNVGQSSEGELVRLIEEKRDDGIYLTILGFGMGNYKDNRMESLSNSGNGNYAYIDTLKEAEKVLVQELSGTLFTIAKDVKIQIEFNPNIIDSYRLVGYENRILDAEDFADDTKDAGDMGAGHSVTVLYELVPADGVSSPGSDLRYQTTEVKDDPAVSNELMYLKFRYKNPGTESSILVDDPVMYDPVDPAEISGNFGFSAAVASFGMILRDSKFSGSATLENVLAMAEQSIGEDTDGYRTELLGMIKLAYWLRQLEGFSGSQ